MRTPFDCEGVPQTTTLHRPGMTGGALGTENTWGRKEMERKREWEELEGVEWKKEKGEGKGERGEEKGRKGEKLTHGKNSTRLSQHQQ